DEAEARRMTPFLNPVDSAVMEARLALAAGSANAAELLERVPDDARNEPGLLFQRLRSAVKDNRDDDANEILLNAPSDLGNPEIWWDQRHIMVRRAIEKKDFALAYHLSERHGQTTPKTLTQAEFLSGWLALRFLNKPDVALGHFQSLYNAASTPITSARGAYWIGRAYEALGQKAEAGQAYSTALTFNTTFYGQLAATRLYNDPILIIKSDPRQPNSVRKAFFARDNIRAIERLTKIREVEKARAFFRAAADTASKRSEFAMLAEVAHRVGRPDFGIMAVKMAGMKNILIQNGGFPVLTVQTPSVPERAFTHALIRQESMFNPKATSSVGARGLMQLMPRTAKDMCKKIGVRFNENRLDEPSHNIQLGTTFAKRQIDRFDGSYILALAGYNAGPGRVRDWIEQFGDPRTEAVDPVDWIEMIPMRETRNYVQRILESLQVYRSKLAPDGKATLLIAKDIRR
ncbi:MAG: lytic transglycosylase domain-containing protein, partial [Alphaproteobacteria bacterium]|nr:lytic transglycosylase domain-containing protein [Alphaproteobacteria bacterium]